AEEVLVLAVDRTTEARVELEVVVDAERETAVQVVLRLGAGHERLERVPLEVAADALGDVGAEREARAALLEARRAVELLAREQVAAEAHALAQRPRRGELRLGEELPGAGAAAARRERRGREHGDIRDETARALGTLEQSELRADRGILEATIP